VSDYLTRDELKTLLRNSLKYLLWSRPKVRIVNEAPAEPPLVSVIIPTYNWSSVLRFAIRSVLWQTEQNFEILVMGDGCTDDSEAVVASFHDGRIHWRNLPANTGHQSAPNNAGLALARGRNIAYLGHDDVWHPQHLATMLASITSAQADFASSLIEMIGPKGTNLRIITGIYPPEGYDVRRGLPPSGLMHRREVVEQIGYWQDYRTICRHPEGDFVHRGFEAGLKFVSTGELTVFKFNSAFRKNSYREKPCHEQRRYVRRMERYPWFQLQEALYVARVHHFHLPVQAPVFPAPPAPDTLGWEVSQFRKVRGLD
jgi:glycosyltransferase involved in cell wall biosynthesis